MTPWRTRECRICRLFTSEDSLVSDTLSPKDMDFFFFFFFFFFIVQCRKFVIFLKESSVIKELLLYQKVCMYNHTDA